jgi:short-chain fatty acids transporter
MPVEQPNAGNDTPLARFGSAIAELSERYFPDAFVFALAAVSVAFLFGLGVGETPATLVREFGGGFWVLVPFTMQMALVIVGGFVVASSRPCSRLIERLAAIPRTPRGAVAFVALFSMLSSLLSWGFSLIFTGLLVREVVRRIRTVDYRAIGSAAYLGLGSVWALGFSSSPALMQATPSAIPPALLPITGVIPLSQTIFLWQSVALAVALIATATLTAWFSTPPPERSRTIAAMGIVFEPLTVESDEARTPAEKVERWPGFSLTVAALMFVWLGFQVAEKGFAAAVDLNNFNFAFLALGLLLHWRPRAFLKAVVRAVPAAAGVLIQFPFYAGIFGMISKTSIQDVLADFFIGITTRTSFPLVVFFQSYLLDLFIPSGGGKWVLEAPYIMAAANHLKMHLGWTIQIYNVAESVANLVNPFWMLPLMGILNVRARDLAGYSILHMLMLLPVAVLLCWLLAFTLPYLPPVVP